VATTPAPAQRPAAEPKPKPEPPAPGGKVVDFPGPPQVKKERPRTAVLVVAGLVIVGAAGLTWGIWKLLPPKKEPTAAEPKVQIGATTGREVSLPAPTPTVIPAPAPQPQVPPTPQVPQPPPAPAPVASVAQSAPPVPAPSGPPTGPTPSPAVASVETLQAALKDKDPEVRLGAALALRGLGQEAKAALPALTAALKDESQQVRVWAALALTKIAPNDPAVVPGLIEALKDKQPTARHAAALSLGLIGIDQPAAKQAGPALAEVAKSDPEEEIRKAAGAALKLIDPDLAAKAGLP